jgi:hypothetical protein
VEGGADEAVALAAGAGGGGSELEALRAENRQLRENVARLDAVASRATVHAETLRRNSELQVQVASAKKTIGRLVQERNATARRPYVSVSNGTTPAAARFTTRMSGGTGDAGGAASRARAGVSAGREISKADSEAIHRVLDWRRSAVVDRSVDGEMVDAPSEDALSHGDVLSARAASFTEFLLDAAAGVSEPELEGPESPVLGSGGSPGSVVAQSVREGGEAGSVRSVAVGGDFRGSAANSVAGDEIHVVPRSNIFSAPADGGAFASSGITSGLGAGARSGGGGGRGGLLGLLG